MTDRIEGQLAEAGRLLCDWRDEHTAALGGADAHLVEMLTPAAPGRAAGLTGLRSAAVAAVVVLLAGVLGAVAWNRRDTGLPVASAPVVVALVPSSTDGWDHVAIMRSEDSEPVESDTGTIVLARPGTDAADGEFVRLSVFHVEGLTNVDGAEQVDIGGRRGWLVEDPNGARSLEVWPPGGAGSLLTAESGSVVSTADIIAVASAFDPDRPLAEQDIPDGWEVAFEGTGLHQAVSRGVYLTRDLGDPDDGAPRSLRGTALSIVTITGIPAPDALWFLASPEMQSVTVRGVEAWLTIRTDLYGTFGVLVWAEGSTTAMVGLTSGEVGIDGAALMVEMAESLVPVDAAGWDEFVRQTPDPFGEPTGGKTSDGSMSDTTIPFDSPTTTARGFPESPPSSSAIEGAFSDGRAFQVMALAGTGELCWQFQGDTVARCDSNESLLIGGEDASQPRAASDGTTSFVYGFLPLGAVEVRVTAVSQRAAVEVATMVGEQIWAADLPPGYGAVDVEYLDGSGTVIAEASMA
jgi:hypothetical protein